MRPHLLLRLLGLSALCLGLACAPGRLLASDFSTPYDPEFPQPKAEQKEQVEQPAEQPVETEAPPETPASILMPSAEPFLLIDRKDPTKLFEQPLSSAPAEPQDFMQFEMDLKPFDYSQGKFNKVREKIEQGIEPGEEKRSEDLVTPYITVSTSVAPKPPPPELELPTYGTSLSVTGRKVIGFQFSEKRYTHNQASTGRSQTTNLIEIDQQLQLRMQGKVGPKITVNVDYDDTKVNHQDISVVYTGDPNEVVQNVSFGDIDLSLPATEFVSYNKQLFGIRADIKYKGLKATVIGSRTKGTTKSKQFFGNTQFVSTDILDTGYVRRQYYDITFGNSARLPIAAGSERVYLSLNSANVAANTNNLTLTTRDLEVQSSTYTGNFSQLNPGIDYTVDYVKGIINFRTALQPEQVLAVDFVDASGNRISVETSSTNVNALGNTCFEPNTPEAGGLAGQPCPILIKTPSDVAIVTASSATETGYRRELKTFYSIGQTQIVRDNGRGNFILRVLDTQRNEVGSALNPPQKYPETINVDFENGVFNLLNPFSVSASSPDTPDPDIYSQTPINKRLFHVEYSYRFKTFFLEPNLVPQSEIVILDNAKLNRNVDYFIDYEAGFITFFNENRITQGSEINISFEVAPFVGSTNESLLGTRVSYDINQHLSVGSTLLYQAGSKAQTVPTVTELARSLMVYDFDVQLKDIRLGSFFRISNLAAEVAQSRQKLNLNDAALVDNMEGIKLEDSASTLKESWFIASNPGGTPVVAENINWLAEDVPVLQINPNAQASSQQTQKVLDVKYDNLAANEEVSLVYPFSIAGNDFTQRTILEVVMLGDLSNNEINFRLGGVDEDADNTGGIPLLTCADGTTRANAPKTEDLNCDGTLQPGEDVGWIYDPAGPSDDIFGAGNGRIDSEDLNANARLDPDDGNGNNFGYGPDLTGLNPQNNLLRDTQNQTHTSIDFGGGNNWRTFQIPLQISTATLSRWAAIKNLRITIRRPGAGGAANGTLKFARVAVVGNTWLASRSVDPANNAGPFGGENALVTPVNNVDNPGYVPIFASGGDATQVFNDLYGSLGNLQKQSNTENVSEQALQIDWSSMTIVGGQEPVVVTKRVFSRAVDISQHRFFNFLVYGNADNNPSFNANDHTFFLRVGNDTNFFEVRVPITFTGWHKISVRQKDSRNDSVADQWVADTPGTVVISSGTPSLQQIGEIVAGVRRNATGVGLTAAGTQTHGRVWLNEIHLTQPMTRVGNARKLEGAFEVPGWATFGGKYREIDRNFQTPTSVVSNQDNRVDSGYLNFTRIRFFPMNFTVQRQITDTPSAAQTGSLSNLVNLLSQGKVTTWTGTAQGNFTLGALPRIGVGTTRNRIDYDLLTRSDDRKTYSGTLQYGVPIDNRFLPKTIDLSYTKSLYDVTFDRLDVLQLPGNFNTYERGQTYAARLTFIPWTASSFNPSYSLTRVKERRDTFAGATPETLNYDKSLSQSVGFSSNYRLNRWLNPQVNYTVDILENNILNISTFVVQTSTYVFGIGEIKTINRSANGSISLPLTIGEIFPNSKLFRSMNIVSGYQLQDGDVWNQVENSLNSQTELWVRTPLRPGNPAARRASMTLRDTYNSTQRWSPLEAYDIKGRLGVFKTLSLSNNYVKSIQRNETTGTPSKTISTTLPDVVASLSQMEKLIFTERWMSNTQMNYKYASRNTETIGQSKQNEITFGTDLRTIIRKRFDTLVSFNLRKTRNHDLIVDANTQNTSHEDATVQVTFDIKKFRFTPKTDFTHDATKLGTGVRTQDVTVITPSMLVRADLALPRGLRLPGSTKTILFSNRIIWTTTLSLSDRRSPVTEADNSRLATMNTSADYELAKNLRMTLNGAMSRLWHKYVKTEEFLSYQFGTTLTFQF